MTPSELKALHEEANPKSLFFDRKSMQFFGDKMSNYGVKSATIGGKEVWELFRKAPVKHGLRKSSYFDKQDYRRVFPQV